MVLRVSDFETVRELILRQLDGYQAKEALDRIEAEVERLTALSGNLLQERNAAWRQVERLKRDVEHYSSKNARLATRNERLRAILDRNPIAQREAILKENERLRAALERIAEQTRWTTDVARSQVLSTKQAIARAALAEFDPAQSMTEDELRAALAKGEA